ncbi:MAG TPA: T9SS type A sorting domain-containing protein [Chryseosolibacter sp.]
MKKVFTVSLFLLLFYHSHAQRIDSLTSPTVWYSADRSLLNTGKWSDISFFKKDALGASATSTPSTYDTINFNKALKFDGLDDYLKIPNSLEGLSDFSILAVFQSADTTERGVWGTEQSLSRKALLTTRRAIGPDTVSDSYGKNERITLLNCVLQNWDEAVTASSSTAYMSLGSAGQAVHFQPFKGALAELIVFNRSLNFLERVQYETYLAIKYGTGLRGSGNFVSSGDRVLWQTEQNKGYGRNIAGIGRDDYFGLYQKQSGSAYDSSLLIMSAAALAPTNGLNNAIIPDQGFILWGDNGLSLSTKRGDGIDSVLMFVQRKWLVTSTGMTAAKGATDVYIDQKRLPAEPLGYWLVIDRSGSGNFSVDNLEYVSPEKIVNGKVLYKVQWDKDGSGKDNFGFARKRELFAVVRTLKNPSCTDETAGKVKIEVIAGKPSFYFDLKQVNGNISRSWRQPATTVNQEDLTKGDYELQLADGASETLTRNFRLTMPDALNINLGADQTFSSANPIVLDVTSQVPDSVDVTYRWENSFGYSSVGEKVTVSEPAVYRVYVTKTKDGCVFTDDVAITGSQALRVAVYPSPVESDSPYSISVSLPETGSVRVTVFDSKGVSASQMTGANTSEYQFITSLKNPGLYVVVIQTAKGIQSYKIIVN